MMVLFRSFVTIFAEKTRKMTVLTGREFRDNMAKYLRVAQGGEDVIIKSRAGTFRIVPITEDDIIISKGELTEKHQNRQQENGK